MFDSAAPPFLPIEMITFSTTLEPDIHAFQPNTTLDTSGVGIGSVQLHDEMAALGRAEPSNQLGLQVAPTRRYATAILN
jgi:hypothetical protein